MGMTLSNVHKINYTLETPIPFVLTLRLRSGLKALSKYKRIYFDKIRIENQTVECTHCIQKMSGNTTSSYAANFAQLVSIIPIGHHGIL